MNMFSREHWDRNRGMNLSDFYDAMDAAKASDDPQNIGDLYMKPNCHKNGVTREDPYGHSVKPKSKTWDHPPATPAEEALYKGVHIHSESNPLGLHTHVPGGTLAGGHSHGPSNRFGTHHHKEIPGDMADTDGHHEHGGVNYPDGSHDHHPDNFG